MFFVFRVNIKLYHFSQYILCFTCSMFYFFITSVFIFVLVLVFMYTLSQFAKYIHSDILFIVHISVYWKTFVELVYLSLDGRSRSFLDGSFLKFGCASFNCVLSSSVAIFCLQGIDLSQSCIVLVPSKISDLYFLSTVPCFHTNVYS